MGTQLRKSVLTQSGSNLLSTPVRFSDLVLTGSYWLLLVLTDFYSKWKFPFFFESMQMWIKIGSLSNTGSGSNLLMSSQVLRLGR